MTIQAGASPFDPNPVDDTDPFSSTGPYAGPPETWQDLESNDDHGRQQAFDIGRRHSELMDRLQALGDANGGGPLGLAVGMMHRAEAAGLLSGQDRDRLTELMAHLVQSCASGTDLDAAMSRLQEIHDGIVNDANAKPVAIATASVALDSVRRAQTHDAGFDQSSYLQGVGDTLGFGFGLFGGPFVAASTCVAVSTVIANPPPLS